MRNESTPKIFYPKCRANAAVWIYDPQTGRDSGILSLPSLPVVNCTVRCNETTTANEFEVEFIENYFPLDPTNIKAMQLDIHMSNGEPGKELTTTSDKTRIIVGHADEVTRSFKNGEVTFMVKGRDFTGLLLDLKWGLEKVDLNQPLKNAIESVLKSRPAINRITVKSDETFFLKGDAKSKKRSQFVTDATTSVWEGLVKLAARAGAILEVENDYIHVMKPRTPNAANDPPVFVEGKNVTNLSLTRGLGKNDAPNIRLKAYDATKGNILIGKFKHKNGAKKGNTVEWLEFTVSKPEPEQAELDKDAEQLAKKLAYKQVQVTLTTADLLIETSEGKYIQTTELRNGSTIRLYINRASRALLDRAITPPERRRKLQAEGFSREAINVIGEKNDIIDKLLFIEKLQHTYSAESGYKLSITATTYVEL